MKWFKIKDVVKEKIIPSDFWLIKNKLNSKIEVNSAKMQEQEGELKEFKIE